MAKNSFAKFSEVFKENIFSIAIDDYPKKGYSHTAILNYYLKSKFIKPLYKLLLAKNDISYAGKNLELRLNNPRGFEYYGNKNIEVILVDDIITTGTTINEAKDVLAKYGVKVSFCLVLVDKRW